MSLMEVARKKLAQREAVQGNGQLRTEDEAGQREALPLPPEPPWPQLQSEAFYGLAGECVRIIEPESEADPSALLIQFLLGFGNATGRTAHFVVEGTNHYMNLFAVLVGTTSKARKGTSWDRVSTLFRLADEQWVTERAKTGLSSGEGVIWNVRDAIWARQPIKNKGRVVGYENIEADPGISDKRLMVVESEFANVLKQTERQGNTLSAILRRAWETGQLESLTKNSPAKATGAHVSIIGHVTKEELTRYLTTTEAASGFGNRFLWSMVRRSKCLPEGGKFIQFAPLAKRLGEALAFARTAGEMSRDEKAKEIWRSVYPELSDGKPGLAGALTARAEAQTLRLACVFALLDCSLVVRAEHLLAALAMWDFCERSTRFIFGTSTGNPLADEILRQLRASPNGLSRNDLRDFFQRNVSSGRIGSALALLSQSKLAKCEMVPTAGRSQERWYAVTP